MDGNKRHHEGQGTARDQERLLRLARLHNVGPVESLITQLVRDRVSVLLGLIGRIVDVWGAGKRTVDKDEAPLPRYTSAMFRIVRAR